MVDDSTPVLGGLREIYEGRTVEMGQGRSGARERAGRSEVYSKFRNTWHA